MWSGGVAQLVAKRTAVWSGSTRSQRSKATCLASAASCRFSSTTNYWFVGESMKKVQPFSCSMAFSCIAISIAWRLIVK